MRMRKLSLSGNLLLAIFLLFAGPIAAAQNSDSGDKHIDVVAPNTDVHLGTDADARKAGVPLYPGARLQKDDDKDNGVNVGVLTQAFGIKLVVAKYESSDSPDKIIAFYRKKLRRYGDVLVCHTHHQGTDVNSDNDKDDDRTAPVKCDDDNTGPVTELKVGTEGDQHVVAVEPGQGGKPTTFAIVYVYTRGKRGEI